jgi:hypothetical protein
VNRIITRVAVLTMIVSAIVVCGCSSGHDLTKEELRAQRYYRREVAEDREYEVRPAGFSIRPVREPFVATYLRRVGNDGIEFFSTGHMMDRDPKFYAGKLSTYFDGVGMYDSASHAITNLMAIVQNSHASYKIEAVSESTYELGDNLVREFRWNLLDGGSTPVNRYQASLGTSHDAEMIGAVIVTEKGTYLVYLVENKMYTIFPHGCEPCRQGWDEISEKEASASMEGRFQEFLHGMRFDIY